VGAEKRVGNFVPAPTVPFEITSADDAIFFFNKIYLLFLYRPPEKMNIQRLHSPKMMGFSDVLIFPEIPQPNSILFFTDGFRIPPRQQR
jgi:hypothetical protein